MKTRSTALCLAATAALLAGCGSSSSTSSTSTPASAGTQASTAAKTGGSAYGGGAYGAAAATSTTAASTPATTLTSKHAKLGTILAAGPKRMTVYLFEADKGASSSCSGTCAQVWPPVTSGAAAKAAGAAMASDLSTITRPDGTHQVVYNGHPLYFYAKDKDAGDSYGQGIKSFGAAWYVLKPNGEKLDSDSSGGSGGS